MRDKLLAGFREKDYDKALLDGVDFISRTVKTKLKTHAEAEGAPLSGQHHGAGREHRDFGQPQQPIRSMGWLGWVIVALVVFLGFRLIGALFGGGGMGGGGGGDAAAAPSGALLASSSAIMRRMEARISSIDGSCWAEGVAIESNLWLLNLNAQSGRQG